MQRGHLLDRLRHIFAALRKGFRVSVLPSNLFVIVAVAVVVASALFADTQNRALLDQQLRAQVTRQVSVLRARLEGNINGNLQLVRGLVATLVTEPEMSQARWARLASLVFREDSQMRNVAGAPDLRITLMYPIEGNEAALGLDYTTQPEQRAAALRARDTGQPVLAGPVDLVQGGRGFIGRFPVFLEDGNPASFWGMPSGSMPTAASAIPVSASKSRCAARTAPGATAPSSSAGSTISPACRSPPTSCCPMARGRCWRSPAAAGWRRCPRRCLSGCSSRWPACWCSPRSSSPAF
jgi:hypothetical protein